MVVYYILEFICWLIWFWVYFDKRLCYVVIFNFLENVYVDEDNGW